MFVPKHQLDEDDKEEEEQGDDFSSDVGGCINK